MPPTVSGNSEPATTEAEAMRRFLLDLGVPAEAIVSESKSKNTLETIRNVRQMVGQARWAPPRENWAPSIAAMAWSTVGLREHVALRLDRRGGI